MAATFRIAEVWYHDFGPFEDVRVNFDYIGLTAIEGVIEGMRGCDSNGAGKSYLLDGPAWAIFGRCIREKYSGDAVRRHQWNEKRKRNVVVKGWTGVGVTLIGPVTLRIERYRKHPEYGDNVYLFVDGEDQTPGTNTETNHKIEQTLGMDFDSFCNSVAFAAREDVKSFFSATDTNRKKVLDSIFGLKVYTKAEQVARQRLRALATELTTLTTKRTILQTKSAAVTERLDGIQGSEDTVEAMLRLKMARVRVARLARAVDRLEREREELGDERVAMEEENRNLWRIYELRQRQHLERASRLTRELANLQKKVGGLETEDERYKKRQQRLENLAGATCPTCEQTLPKAKAKKLVDAQQAEWSENTLELNSAEAQLDSLQHEIDSLEHPHTPEHLGLDTVKQLIEINNEQALEASAELREATAELKMLEAEYGNREAQLSDLQAQLKGLKAELAETEERYVELSGKSDQLEFWVDAFSNQGIKSFLLESELPEVNRRASKYAQMLLGDGSVVQLNATTQLKSKDAMRERISIDVIVPGCTNSYEGASRGQKHRINLSLIMALGEIVAERSAKSIDNFFADEVFDGVDKTGQECEVELLRKLAKDRPVVFVTHDTAMKGVADRAITVYHGGRGKTAILKGGVNGTQAQAEKPTPRKRRA